MKKIYAIGFLILSACASVKPPNGGPKDNAAPKLISYQIKDSSQTWLHHLRFDEKIDLANTSKLFFLPTTKTDKIRLKSKTLIIRTEPILGNYQIVANGVIKDITENNINDTLDIHISRRSKDSIALNFQIIHPITQLLKPIDSFVCTINNHLYRFPIRDSIFNISMLPKGTIQFLNTNELPTYTTDLIIKDSSYKLFTNSMLSNKICLYKKHLQTNYAYITKTPNLLPNYYLNEKLGFYKIQDTVIITKFIDTLGYSNHRISITKKDSLLNKRGNSRILNFIKNDTLFLVHPNLRSEQIEASIIKDSLFLICQPDIHINYTDNTTAIVNTNPYLRTITFDTIIGNDSTLYPSRTYKLPKIDTNYSLLDLVLPKSINFPISLFFMENSIIKQVNLIKQITHNKSIRIKSGTYTLTIVEDTDANQKLSVYKNQEQIHQEGFFYYKKPIKIPENWEIKISISEEDLDVHKSKP